MEEARRHEGSDWLKAKYISAQRQRLGSETNVMPFLRPERAVYKLIYYSLFTIY